MSPYARLCRHTDNREQLCCTECGFSYSLCEHCNAACPTCGGSLEECRHTRAVHADE
jgi:hypothetical protein